MQPETLVAVVRGAGIVAAVMLGTNAFSTMLRHRESHAALWILVAALALGCAVWVRTSGPRALWDIWPELVSWWLVPALAMGVVARRWHGWILALGAAGTVVAVLHQPFWDEACVGACEPQDALIVADPRLSHLGGVIVALAALAMAFGVLRRAALAGVAAAASLFWSLHPWVSDSPMVDDVVVGVLSAAAVLTAVTAWPPAIRAARADAELRALGAADPAPVDRLALDRRLARLLGDPTVRVIFPWEPAGADRVRSGVSRNGVAVASIETAAPVDAGELAAALTPAVRAGIDNERLRSEIAAQVAELDASRSRIIESSAAERHRLERNVHDGVQQYLIALLAELGLAATSDGTKAAAAADQTRAVLEELRSLTRGIASPVLEADGLAAAVAALADRTDAVLTVRGDLQVNTAVARDVYSVIATVARTADRLGLSAVTVQVRPRDELIVIVVNPGQAAEDTLQARVDALGGSITRSGDGAEVSLPCAS